MTPPRPCKAAFFRARVSKGCALDIFEFFVTQRKREVRYKAFRRKAILEHPASNGRGEYKEKFHYIVHDAYIGKNWLY